MVTCDLPPLPLTFRAVRAPVARVAEAGVRPDTHTVLGAARAGAVRLAVSFVLCTYVAITTLQHQPLLPLVLELI